MNTGDGVIHINFDDAGSSCETEPEKIMYTTSKQKIVEPETVEESKDYLKKLQDFVQTKNFVKLCDKWEKQSGYDKKKIAKGFFQRILGTVGDFSCIGLDTFESIVHHFVSILANLIKLGVTIIVKLAKAGFRIITLNYTRG